MNELKEFWEDAHVWLTGKTWHYDSNWYSISSGSRDPCVRGNRGFAYNMIFVFSSRPVKR